MSLGIEAHSYTIISSTDSYLRLFDQVGLPNVGANMDVRWPFLQREYVPLSIHKLGGRLLHTHVRDGDGLYNYNMPVGMGIIDWRAVVEALKDIAYDGFLSLELSNYQDPIQYLEFSRDYLQSVLAE